MSAQPPHRHEGTPAVASERAQPLTVKQLLLEENVACFTVDAEQRIILWDSKAERLFGFKAARVLGCRCCEAICPTGEASFCASHREVLDMARRGELPKTMHMELFRADGLIVHVEVTVVPVLVGSRARQMALLHFAKRLTQL